MAAHDLLLLHGTVYGQISPDSPGFWEDNTPLLSANVNRWGSAAFWLTGIPHKQAAPVQPVGTLTDNGAMDFISWGGLTGTARPVEMEWWRQCMTLFMRHI